MRFRCIRAELLKLGNSKIWLIAVVLPLAGVFIGTGNYYMNQGILSKEWYSLWTQVSLFYAGFFYPAAIAVFCSYLCRLEHLNRNWNKVMTMPVPVGSIYIAKLISVTVLIVVTQAVLAVFYWIAGRVVGISGPFPVEFWGWMLRGVLGAVTIGALQLILSIRLRSFAAPVGICLFLCILGFGFFLKAGGSYFPYSFLIQGMSAVSQEGFSEKDNILFVVMNGVFLAGATGYIKYFFYKKDIVA